MDWWNDLTDWLSSDDGWRVLSGAIIPFVAIVVAGVVAALIGRGATKRVVALQEREARNAAVAGIVAAARKAATWGSLGHDERAYADHLAEDADIRMRLLPVAGAPLAANWAQHEIADIKKNSSTFSFQADQSLAEFRDRMLEWQARPSRARKLFKSDLERWKFDSPDPDAELIARQQEWNADRTATNRPQDTPTASATTTGGASGAAAGAETAAGGPATDEPSTGSTPGFSVSRGDQTHHDQSDQNATTPFGATGATTPFGATGATTPFGATGATTPIADAGVTRASGEGITRPYGDGTTPVRPTLGSPSSPAAQRQGSAVDQDDDAAVDDGTVGHGSAARSADAHVNRSGGSPVPDGSGSGTSGTTSVPARIAGAPAEPTDADETSESTYTQPISASELRRRAADDED